MSETQPFDKISLLRLAFKGLADEELQEMAAATRLCTYPPGHILCHEGAYEDIFYIIADGNAVISKNISEQDGERILRIAGKGDLVGEMALIQNVPRSATVRTTTDCTVLEMDKKDFETLLGRSPSMAINIIRTTLDRIRENDQMAIQELQNANKVLRQSGPQQTGIHSGCRARTPHPVDCSQRLRQCAAFLPRYKSKRRVGRSDGRNYQGR